MEWWFLSVVEMSRIGTKFLCLYTYKKCIGSSVTQHLYSPRDLAHQNEWDEISHVAVVLSANIQSVCSQKCTLN